VGVLIFNFQYYSPANVGCINAVSCTKMFKFIMVYDALLILPTLANAVMKFAKVKKSD